MQKVLFAAFRDMDDAERAYHELELHDFNVKELSIIAHEHHHYQETEEEHGVAGDAAAGAAGGVVTGGVLGGIAGFLAGAGIVPALAGLLIGGPIAVALGLTGVAAATASGVVTGALAGGLVGALMGLGLSKEEAEGYERTIHEGGMVIGVPVSDATEAEVRAILITNHADQLKAISMNPSPQSLPERRHRTAAVKGKKPKKTVRRTVERRMKVQR